MIFLIIDDNPTDRLIAKLVIKQKYEAAIVIETGSAREGISWLEQNRDTQKIYILLDIRMPEVDGFGFLLLYEQLPISSKLDSEIVMLSSTLDSSDIQKANEHKNVKKLLEKPLQLEKLTLVITQE